jgi:hypothetical protein|tara:strand:+ start:261 stop:728 length:468 start_codon:yes stop_codon:yes gene_type:complete
VSTRRLLAAPLVALLLLSCADEDSRLSTPATTFGTYRRALADGDGETAWFCLSSGYRRLEYNDDPQLLKAHLEREGGALGRRVARLEIGQETEINERLAFLQFDPTTVDPSRTPFYYFLHEQDGWKITTHLDSLFRGELEGAIERGEFRLPVVTR